MYSHDGIRDSLTQLAAPTLLYEELRRELAWAKREGQAITLVRFLLIPSSPQHRGSTLAAYSEFEEQVINFAQTLTHLSRGEDICARMGELEFVCVLHGLERASGNFISRISLRWCEGQAPRSALQGSSNLSLEVASLASKPSECALDFLNRLDLVPTTVR